MGLIKISIDLTKIDKSKIKYHVNGSKYYAITIAELAQVDDYENTHTVYDTQTKTESENNAQKNWLGKGKEIKYKPPGAAEIGTTPTYQAPGTTDDDLPF